MVAGWEHLAECRCSNGIVYRYVSAALDTRQAAGLNIECLADRAIPPAFQKTMYTAMPFQKILSLQSSHSPFYSVPEELVKQLTLLSLD